jgi:hypothetical protein
METGYYHEPGIRTLMKLSREERFGIAHLYCSPASAGYCAIFNSRRVLFFLFLFQFFHLLL